MQQSEPANPRSLRAERNTIRIHGSAIAAEISGYADIGMKREALRLTGRVLAKRRILPEEFGEAVRTIGMLSDFKKWKTQLEAAYNRQSKKFKRSVRPDMLATYVCLKEWQTALQFVSVREGSIAPAIFFGMTVLLELDKLEDAKLLAARCTRALSSANNRFEQSLLLDTLGSFFARTHSWDHAIAAWQLAPVEVAFGRDALSGIVKIHLARALESIETGLRKLAELKQQTDESTSLCLPGNDLALTLQAEKELLKFRRGIKKLLPEKARKQLGISN